MISHFQKAIFFIAITSVYTIADAAIISPDDALAIARERVHTSPGQVAQSLYRNTSQRYGALPASDLALAYTQTDSRGCNAVYVFAPQDKSAGYTVVAATDYLANPIAGYSDSGVFSATEMPDNFRYWLEEYARQVEYIELHPQAARTPSATASYPNVSPLLGSISYNQSDPYNRLCPTLNGARTVTGCVATAVSMVMKYWNYPDVGAGSNTYTWSAGSTTLSADFSEVTLDWDLILDTYKNVTATSEQINEVAKLMYNVGVSCNMSYNVSSAGGSGAVTARAIAAMHQNWKYTKQIEYVNRNCSSVEECDELIRENLVDSMPVIFTGRTESNGGHCFVLDGCNTSGYFHVNWGWGGTSNGYFLSTLLSPSSQGIGGSGSGYNLSQACYLNIHPAYADDDEGKVYAMLYGSGSFVADRDVTPRESATVVFTLNGFTGYFGTESIKMRVGIGVYDKADSLVYFRSMQTWQLTSGSGYNDRKFTVKLPATLSDGSYRVFPVYTEATDTKYENLRPIRLPLTEQQYVPVVVQGDSYYTYEYHDPYYSLLEATIPETMDVDSLHRIDLKLKLLTDITQSDLLTHYIVCSYTDESDTDINYHYSPDTVRIYAPDSVAHVIFTDMEMPKYNGTVTFHVADSLKRITLENIGSATLTYFIPHSFLACSIDTVITAGENYRATLAISGVDTEDNFKAMYLAFTDSIGQVASAKFYPYRVSMYTNGAQLLFRNITISDPGVYTLALFNRNDRLLDYFATSIVVRDASGVDAVISDNNPQVVVDGQNIIVTTHTDDTLEIYSTSGIKIKFTELSAGTTCIAMPSAGPYILRFASSGLTKIVL